MYYFSYTSDEALSVSFSPKLFSCFVYGKMIATSTMKRRGQESTREKTPDGTRFNSASLTKSIARPRGNYSHTVDDSPFLRLKFT